MKTSLQPGLQVVAAATTSMIHENSELERKRLLRAGLVDSLASAGFDLCGLCQPATATFSLSSESEARQAAKQGEGQGGQG